MFTDSFLAKESVISSSNGDWELFKFSSKNSSSFFKGFWSTSLRISFSPKGATSHNETATSQPICKLTFAWEGKAWISSTSSTRGSYLLVRT